MESIFAHLDLNVVGLLWHGANFLLLLGVIWWLFFRPITRLLEARQNRVRESLLRAEEIDKQAVIAEAERGELLAAAYGEARAIRARAEEQAHRLLIKSRANAREEAERIVARAAETVANQPVPSNSSTPAQAARPTRNGTSDAGLRQQLEPSHGIVSPVGRLSVRIPHKGGSREAG
jgi:F0F1-type ATP synthase membrane subunit b/b'